MLQNNLEQVERRDCIIAFIICVVTVFVLFYLKYPQRLPYGDEYEYLGYAYGVFKFGIFGQVKQLNVTPDVDLFFPPVYPYFLSFMMYLDDGLVKTFECVLSDMGTGTLGAYQSKADCTPDYNLVIGAQVLMSAVTIFFVWLTALRLGNGSKKIAYFTAFLAVVSKVSYSYANFFLTETSTLFLAAGLGWSLVWLWQECTAKSALACGVFFAILVMTRAGWSYAILVMVPILLTLALLSWKEKGVKAFLPLIVFLCVYGSALTPWLLRNAIIFDTPSLTGGYSDRILTHRVPYNLMTTDEMIAAYVYWLPDFGDSLAATLFPKGQYERLDFNASNGFFQGARYKMMAEANSKRGDQSLFDYLLEHEVVGNLGQHVAVTMALVSRGMWVGKYWGLVAWMFYLPLLVFALYKRWGSFIVVSLPPLFILGLSAFVSVSIPRYNLALIPVLSFSVAYVLAQAVEKFKNLRRATG
ncbi:MAG: hypothetical protein HWE34_06100 [Methylocystaceae bacterium]|nr:hypothetical protein [Methylocystaceae bacterium]